MWKRTALPDLAATEQLQKSFRSMCDANGFGENNALHVLMRDGVCRVYLSPATAVWSYDVSHLAEWKTCGPPPAEAHLVLRGTGPTERGHFLEKDRAARAEKKSG